MVEAPPITPEPPAMAYTAVEAMLAPAYFRRPPPETGIELVIEGTDRKQTTWCFHPAAAAQIAALVIAHPGLRLIAERPYTPPPPRGDAPE